uniref:B30.2/SPRY domain-containing protein n=1 Tax=Ornithorhynchus anatinus TaxID=9258 RepID=A0A6I8NA71_ORNAN
MAGPECGGDRGEVKPQAGAGAPRRRWGVGWGLSPGGGAERDDVTAVSHPGGGAEPPGGARGGHSVRRWPGGRRSGGSQLRTRPLRAALPCCARARPGPAPESPLPRAPNAHPHTLSAAHGTLDPDTAFRLLVLSEDRKRATVGYKLQDLPNNPERFTGSAGVRGHESFTSRRHCWAVEVGEATVWSLGVCRENVRRKWEISESPTDGFWAVKEDDGEYWALTSPRVPLPLTTSPSRVVVYLDFEAGDVSFYSGTDGSHIYTFPRAAFSGALRPFFCFYRGYESLTICLVPGGAGENPVPDPAQETPVSPPEGSSQWMEAKQGEAVRKEGASMDSTADPSYMTEDP